MANTRSSRKRMRQARARTVRNRVQRSALRTALRKVRAAGSKADARTALLQAERLLDRAARANLIHPNAAARHKTRLHKLVAQKT